MVKKADEAPLAPFGVAIRAAIKRSPFANRTRFCEAARLQPKQLRRYELGTVAPRTDQVAAWAELLECSVRDLLPDAGASAPPVESRIEREDSQRHPAVDEFVAEKDLGDDEADYLRSALVFTKKVHTEDVRDLMKAALEKYQLRKLKSAPAEPSIDAVGNRRTLAERDAEIAARKAKKP